MQSEGIKSKGIYVVCFFSLTFVKPALSSSTLSSFAVGWLSLHTPRAPSKSGISGCSSDLVTISRRPPGYEKGVEGFYAIVLFGGNQVSDMWEKWGLTYGEKGVWQTSIFERSAARLAFRFSEKVTHGEMWKEWESVTSGEE